MLEVMVGRSEMTPDASTQNAVGRASISRSDWVYDEGESRSWSLVWAG